MKKSKTKQVKSKAVSEPAVGYNTNRIKIFHSFEEQEKYELTQMAALTGKEILLQLRQFINIAYRMHGYNPDNLPQQHNIKIVSADEHFGYLHKKNLQ